MKATVTENNGSLELVEVNPMRKYTSLDGVLHSESYDFWEANMKPAKVHTEDKDLIVGDVVDLDDYEIVKEYWIPSLKKWITYNPFICNEVKQTRQVARKKAATKTDYPCTQCGSKTAIDPNGICEDCEDKQILAEAKRNAEDCGNPNCINKDCDTCFEIAERKSYIGVLTGEDAERFHYNMNNPTPVSEEEKERIKANYDKMVAIAAEGKETEQSELWNELLADVYQVIDFKLYPERLSFFKSKYTITKK